MPTNWTSCTGLTRHKTCFSATLRRSRQSCWGRCVARRLTCGGTTFRSLSAAGLSLSYTCCCCRFSNGGRGCAFRFRSFLRTNGFARQRRYGGFVFSFFVLLPTTCRTSGTFGQFELIPKVCRILSLRQTLVRRLAILYSLGFWRARRADYRHCDHDRRTLPVGVGLDSRRL